MKRLILITILSCLFYYSCNKNKTELIFLGTVHRPIESFSPDTLYNILEKIKPDLILFEVDSSFFDESFKFTKTWDSNENIATIKYMNNYDVKVRPYDFTGRNEYRLKIGSRPTDSKATGLLRTLYDDGKLTEEDEDIYKRFLRVNDTLNSFAYKGVKYFNNSKSDSVAKLRQKLQYKSLLNVMENYPVFRNTYHVKEDGDSISYYEGFKRAGDFWDLRNKTMAKHIFHFVKEKEGNRIVVLNGYYHRHYIYSLLKEKEKEEDFVIKEFYDYK